MQGAALALTAALCYAGYLLLMRAARSGTDTLPLLLVTSTSAPRRDEVPEQEMYRLWRATLGFEAGRSSAVKSRRCAMERSVQRQAGWRAEARGA